MIGKIGVDGARSKAMEHTGEALRHIDMEARLTMTNMAIEAGAKNGIMEYDEITKDYLDGRAKRPYTPVTSDPDAEYEKLFEFDAEKVELGVAKPMSPDNYAPLSEVAGTKLDQVFIGSCTNSRITDLRRAAAVLEGHKVARGVRLIITPSSHQVAIQAEKEGLIRHVPRRGRRLDDRHLRRLPGRSHGRPRRRRGLPEHDQPELPRPHGPPEGAGLPLEPGGRGRERRDRRDHPPAGRT